MTLGLKFLLFMLKRNFFDMKKLPFRCYGFSMDFQCYETVGKGVCIIMVDTSKNCKVCTITQC